MWYCCCNIKFAWHGLLYLVLHKAPMQCRVNFTQHQWVVLTHVIYIYQKKMSVLSKLCAVIFRFLYFSLVYYYCYKVWITITCASCAIIVFGHICMWKVNRVNLYYLYFSTSIIFARLHLIWFVSIFQPLFPLIASDSWIAVSNEFYCIFTVIFTQSDTQ